MTHQQTAVLISDPSSTAVTTDHMGEITERLIAGHEEVGIICVSGRRDEKKGILLNYITHYISWLSSDEGAGQDYRNMIFLQKWQALDGGVYMWPDPFLVRTENKMGIVDQKLPLLLIDASPEDGTSAAHICVHFMRTAVFSPGDIVNEINKMIIKWGDAKQDISDQMSAGTDGQDSLICLLRDWSTHVPALITEDWFSLPQHSLDVRYFLKSFVYHMFGNVCQSQHSDDILAKQRICRNVFYKSPDEHVVEGMVRVYLNRMRRQLSGPEVSVESLNMMHTKILKEVMEQLRVRNFPVQFKLRIKPIVNKRLNEEFKFLSERYQCLMQQPKELLDLQLQKQYIVAIQDAIAGNGIDDHELLRIHTTEKRKVMSAFRTQCQASDQDLSERITAAFRGLMKLNAESRKQQEPVVLDDLTGKFAQMFANDMTVYVNGLDVMDTKQAKKQQEVIYGRLLWKIDKSLKDQKVKPTDQKKQKKEIEQQVNMLSDEIIKKRDDELQVQAKRMDTLFMQYVKKMQHEMDSAPFMDREESDGKHEKVMKEFLNQWHDEGSKHVLRDRLEREYLIQWQQLQEEKGKRPARIHHFVTKLVSGYEKAMSKVAQSTQNKKKLDEEHSKNVKTVLSMYKDNEDVKDVGHHLPQIEEGLKEQLNQSYDNMWKDQEKKMQEAHDHALATVTLLVDQLVNEYIERMSQFVNRTSSRGTTLDSLNREHDTIQKSIMKKFNENGFVKRDGNSMAHLQQSLNDKISDARRKVKVENPHPLQGPGKSQQPVEVRNSRDYVRYNQLPDEDQNHASVGGDAFVNQLVNEYNERMSDFCRNAKIGATTIPDLEQEHATIQRSIMKTVRESSQVQLGARRFDDMEQKEVWLKEKMKQSFAGYKVEMESRVQGQVLTQRQELVERGLLNYVSGIVARFGVHPPVSVYQYEDVHTMLMDTELGKLESSHLLRSCSDRHEYRSQLVSCIESENERFRAQKGIGYQAGASAYCIKFDDRDSAIEEAVTDASAFYTFFMQYCLMGEKKNQLKYVDIYNRNFRVYNDSMIHLELKMRNMSQESVLEAQKKLNAKNVDDLAIFASEYAKQHHNTGYRDALVNWTISKFSSQSSSPNSGSFLDNFCSAYIERMMNQLYHVRVERFMREQPNAGSGYAAVVKNNISEAIVNEMQRNRISEDIVDAVRTRLNAETFKGRETCV